jgi:hypothetical protein
MHARRGLFVTTKISILLEIQYFKVLENQYGYFNPLEHLNEIARSVASDTVVLSCVTIIVIIIIII